MYQAVQQPRWKAEQLTAELQQQLGAAASPAAGSSGEEQHLQALRLRVLGLERQPYLRFSVKLLHDAAEPSDPSAKPQPLLARQVSAEPRVWQWPGGVVPSWAVFTVQLKVALLVAELTRAISRLAAQQQQQQQQSYYARQGADEAEQRKKEKRRLKRQMRDEQRGSAVAEVQPNAEE
jgi:hypothetical protein